MDSLLVAVTKRDLWLRSFKPRPFSQLSLNSRASVEEPSRDLEKNIEPLKSNASNAEFMGYLDTWEKQGSAFEKRREAKKRILHFLSPSSVVLRAFGNQAAQTLDLSGLKLESFPDILHQEPFSSKLASLNLAKNNLTAVPNLKSLKALESLDLSYNSLKAFPSYILPKIKKMDLSFNDIKNIRTYITDLHTLTVLNLTSNKNLDDISWEILKLPRSCTIYLSESYEHSVRDIFLRSKEPKYTGPKIIYSF